MLHKAKAFLTHRRTSFAWLLVAIGAGFILAKGSSLLLAQLGVLAWKIVLVGVAVAVAHTLRKQVFWYLDLSETTKPAAGAHRALLFLAIVIFYAAIILAITQGL